MITVLHGGEIYDPSPAGKKDIVSVGCDIDFIGAVDRGQLAKSGLSIHEIDCTGCVIVPGFIDCHVHIIGGSAEKGGLAHATPEIFFSEFVGGGTTTVVGTLGVDTSTKTMRALVAKVKTLKQEGLSAYCYTGGYDIPPASLFDTVREDLIFVDEVIGVGEIAISDRRAIEPDMYSLARVATDAYVCGVQTGKAGVLHVHAGPGRELLKPLHRLLDEFEIKPETIYVTHVERTAELVEDGVKLSKRGSFIDFDVQEKDLHKWFTHYRDHGGRMDHLSASSDSGSSCPRFLHQQIQECVLKEKVPLEEILPLVTSNPARALRFDRKGKIAKGCDADLVALDAKTLEVRHVLALGKVLMEDGKFVKREIFLDGFGRKIDLHA